MKITYNLDELERGVNDAIENASMHVRQSYLDVAERWRVEIQMQGENADLDALGRTALLGVRLRASLELPLMS